MFEKYVKLKMGQIRCPKCRKILTSDNYVFYDLYFISTRCSSRKNDIIDRYYIDDFVMITKYKHNISSARIMYADYQTFPLRKDPGIFFVGKLRCRGCHYFREILLVPTHKKA